MDKITNIPIDLKKLNKSYFSFSAAEIPNYKVIYDSHKGYYYLEGEFFKEIKELYERSNIHRAFCNNEMRKIVGSNILGNEQLIKLYGWDKLYKLITRDYKLYGGLAIEIVWNTLHTKILESNWLDITKVRIGNIDEKTDITELYYYSNNWYNSRKKVIVYQRFNTDPLSSDKQIIYFKENDSQIYPNPSYSLIWPYIDKQLGVYYANLVKNNFVTNAILSVYGEYTLNDEKKIEFEKSLKDTLTGSENAGGIFIMYADNKESEPVLTKFNNEADDTKYQWLTDQTIQQLIVAHNISNPMLAGIKTPGELGGGSGEELKISELIYNINVIQPKRSDILANSFDIINPYMINGAINYTVKNIDIFPVVETPIAPISSGTTINEIPKNDNTIK
jgi:hypothetical protein